MKFVNVVPVRRMPADRPWLTYTVPESMDAPVGSLVTVPLRGRPIQGVTWSKTDTQPPGQVQPVTAVHLASPLMSAWQMRVCEVMAATGSASLGDVLWRVIPKLALPSFKKIYVGKLIEQSEEAVVDNFLWYRDRRQCLDDMFQFVRSQAKRSMVILTPTKDDAEEIVRGLESLGRVAVHIHSQLPPTVYADWCNRIRHGQPIITVGGISALALPFPCPPQIIFDQEEHHAHKQTEQFPYYDTRVILEQLGAPSVITTPAPNLSTYEKKQPTIPLAAVHRQLASFHGPHPAPLLTETVLTVIDEQAAAGRQIICISPRRGYASTTVCRACGAHLACPTCGRTASVFHGVADEARCHACQTSIPLSTVCPACGSVDWTFHSYGIEQTVAALQRLRPALKISPVVRADVGAQVMVDTYQAYRTLRQINNVGAIILISGDSLLTRPDYSVAERAWQYLARLQAEAPNVPCLVQTFEPESLFWQRWLHGDDRTWYEDELRQRQRLHLPPGTVQWIAHVRGDQSLADDKKKELATEYGQALTIRTLPTRGKPAGTQRLLLIFSNPALAKTLPWTKFFPLPWRLDQHPTSWTD